MKHDADLLEQLEYFRTLWTKAMPSIVPPPDDRILYWLGEFEPARSIVTYGIMRTQRKFRKRPNVADAGPEYWRYAGGVMANESKHRAVQAQVAENGVTQ